MRSASTRPAITVSVVLLLQYLGYFSAMFSLFILFILCFYFIIIIIQYIYIAQVRRRKRRKCTRVHSCMSNGKVFSLFLNVFIAMSGFRSVCFVRYLAYLATIKYTYIHT